MRFKTLILWLPFACIELPAFGIQGHEVIGALASKMLTAKSKAAVVGILEPNMTLDKVTTWADDIKSIRPETRPFHYVTIQLDQDKYDPALTDSVNIINATLQFTAALKKSTSPKEREEALKWLAHLVGDCHQPLHVGEDQDRGGNNVWVRFKRRKYNLHEVWDYVLLEHLKLETREITALLWDEIAMDAGFQARYASGEIESWVNETHAMSKNCYVINGKPLNKTKKQSLTEEYVRENTLVSIEQLKIAGVRLAYLLNSILDSTKVAKPSNVSSVIRSKPDQESALSAKSGDFFARADSIRALSGAASPIITVQGKYTWSRNSKIYHLSSCSAITRIKKKNLVSGSRFPRGKKMHAGCAKGAEDR